MEPPTVLNGMREWDVPDLIRQRSRYRHADNAHQHEDSGMDQNSDTPTTPVDLAADRAPLLVEGEPVWERMGKLSRFCVELVARHFGETLDYSPGSIRQLDRIILSGWGDNIRVDEIDPGVVQTLGSYVGEILVRRTSGRWVSGLSDDDPGAVLFLNPDESIRLSF